MPSVNAANRDNSPAITVAQIIRANFLAFVYPFVTLIGTGFFAVDDGDDDEAREVLDDVTI